MDWMITFLIRNNLLSLLSFQAKPDTMAHMPKEKSMPLPYEESSPRSTNVMYIRGIPFQCPGSGNKGQSDAVAPRPRPAETCANRLLARRLAAEAPGVGTGRVEARVQAGLMESRRAVRVFTDRIVPMRRLRELVLTACATGPGEKVRPVGFVMVEARDVTSRIADMVASWLRREGLSLDVAGRETDARRVLFGGAPHLAVAHGPAGVAGVAEACALAVARLEWAAAKAGLGSCCAGELVQAAVGDSAVAAALSVPSGHAVYAALLLGQPAVAAANPDCPPDTTIIWL
jgi:nitroreductase